MASTIYDKTLAALNYMLTLNGQMIKLRNPVKTLPADGSPWYETFRFYTEFSVRALPISAQDSSGGYYRDLMPGTNVAQGTMEWAFRKGDQEVSPASKVVVDKKIFSIKQVKAKLFVGTTPLVQHIVVGL